jgi:hypothetical protein
MHILQHDLWRYLHILLFVFWLGADVGVYTTMAYIKNPRLPMETRLTLIRFGFLIDMFPRTTFALLIPVGMHLARDLALLPVTAPMLVAAWLVGLGWASLPFGIFFGKGSPLARRLAAINRWFEALAGAAFIFAGGLSLATGTPVAAGWFASKLILFGLIFWIILGIDTKFQPFTTLINMARDGVTEAGEARVRRTTNITMAWALLLYFDIALIAFMGVTKPFY